MNNKLVKIFAVSLVILFCVASFTFSKTQKSNEFKFQLGFGGFASTANLLGLIEDVKMVQSLNAGTSYDYPGLTEEQKESLTNLSVTMQRAIVIANILGAMEYGLHMRILWNILISEVDLTLLPFDGSYNGRLDFALTGMVGIRAPFFIMPYIMAGVIFTFSFYPDKVTTLENWRTLAVFDKFAFSPGLNTRVGLDLKLGKFAIGGYYQYQIKDFQAFGSWFWHLCQDFNASEAAGKIFGSQSRFGAIITFYL